MTGDVKYERVNDFECRKCPNAILNAFRVIGAILLVILFYIIMVVINVRKTSESGISVLTRILANYLQLLTVSVSMTNEFPSVITAISIPVKMFGGSTDTFMSFDCFIEDSEVKFIFDSNAVFKLFLLMFLPLLLFLIMAVMWIIVKKIKPDSVRDLKRNIVISFISVVFLLHPKLTERSVSLFKCVEIDDGFKVVSMDTTIE